MHVPAIGGAELFLVTLSNVWAGVQNRQYTDSVERHADDCGKHAVLHDLLGFADTAVHAINGGGVITTRFCLKEFGYIQELALKSSASQQMQHHTTYADVQCRYCSTHSMSAASLRIGVSGDCLPAVAQDLTEHSCIAQREERHPGDPETS